MVENFDKMLTRSLRLGAPWYTSKSIVMLLFLQGKISLHYPTGRFWAKWPKKDQKIPPMFQGGTASVFLIEFTLETIWKDNGSGCRAG